MRFLTLIESVAFSSSEDFHPSFLHAGTLDIRNLEPISYPRRLGGPSTYCARPNRPSPESPFARPEAIGALVVRLGAANSCNAHAVGLVVV